MIGWIRASVVMAFALLSAGCISVYRFASVPLIEANLPPADEAVALCVRDTGLVVLGDVMLSDDHVCGVWKDGERLCHARDSIERMLVPRLTTISAFDPLFMGPSCGVSTNAPMQVYADGVMRFENGDPSGWRTSPDPRLPSPPDQESSGGEN